MNYSRSLTKLCVLVIALASHMTSRAQINVGPNNGIGPVSFSSIAGGDFNTNNANFSIIGGGYVNFILTNADYSAIGGGWGNIAGGQYSFVGGGGGNTASGLAATIGGGSEIIASGENSTVAGGDQNSASGVGATVGGGAKNRGTNDYGTVSGGLGNVADGAFSMIPGGRGARASAWGQFVHASGNFENATGGGSAQASFFVLRQTSASTNKVELFLDGVAERMKIPVGATWTFDLLITARSTNGNSSGWQVRGVIENVNGTVSKIGSFPKTAIGEDVTAWAVDINADDVNDCLSVKATGDTSAIRWVASVRTVEVKN